MCIRDSFKDVYKLQPGEILRFHKGEIKTWKYWDIADVYHKMQKNPVTDFGEAKAELKRLLQKAVASRMIADVPLGSFLSGGYDSSLMTAVAQENSPEPVKTCLLYTSRKYSQILAISAIFICIR